MSRCLASLHGVLAGARSPVSSVLPRHSDFLPALPPHFVSFAWRYHGSTRRFAPAAAECCGHGPGVGHPGSPSGYASVETTGSPRFLGNPHPRLHMVFDPGRPIRLKPSRGGRVAPANERTKAPTKSRLSRLDSMAFGLTAYVSRTGFPSTRKAGFQVLVRLSWAGFPPAGFQ
jgi:hypothetical protein